MSEQIYEIIMTTKIETLEASLNEILKVDNKAKVKSWLDNGISIVSLPSGYNYLIDEFRKKPPIFIQHICPINHSIQLNNDESDIIEISRICETSLKFPKNESFSVQCRIFAKDEKSNLKQDIFKTITEKLVSLGYNLDVSKPKQIISITVTDNLCFIGFSVARDNLSDWVSGQHRFLRETSQLSRAEFKLLEALDYYEINFTKEGKAIDLGAAPGGWTRVLLNNGMTVYAVDPASLHESLADEPNLLHFKEIAQVFFKRDLGVKFDLIVNDMRMDSKESAFLIEDAIDILKDNGLVIMTLKLPKKGIQKRVNETLKILEKKFNIVGARQLFHNRSEVTVLLTKR